MVKQLKGITATYRMTSKGPPQRHSHYVTGILTPLTAFTTGEAGGCLSPAAQQSLLHDTVEIINQVPYLGAAVLLSALAGCSSDSYAEVPVPAMLRSFGHRRCDAESLCIQYLVLTIQINAAACNKVTDCGTCFLSPQRYKQLADELIVTVQKTETSLKRLKKGKQGEDTAEASAMSDCDKICLQLFLDVREYGRLAASQGVGVQQQASYRQLWRAVAPKDQSDSIQF